MLDATYYGRLHTALHVIGCCQPLGYVNFTNVIFRPRKKLIRICFLERSANFYLTLPGENSTVLVTIYHIVCFEAATSGLVEFFKRLIKMCRRLTH